MTLLLLLRSPSSTFTAQGPLALAVTSWDVSADVTSWDVSADVTAYDVAATVPGGSMHVGDTARPLTVRCRYVDPTLDPLDLPVGLTAATVTVELIGSVPSDTPAVDAQPIQVISSDAGVVTFSRDWVAGETDTPGRYSVIVRVSIGGKAITFPSSGRSVLTINP